MSPITAGMTALIAAVLWIVVILAVINLVSPILRFLIFLVLVAGGALFLGLFVFHGLVH